ncbi:MAG: phage integrase N-terminal SAM-like domain-containing protein [Burkholderiales bacterium]
MHWIKRLIFFHGKHHPHLAADRRVAAATQSQALSALLFLYKQVLAIELLWLDGVQRPTRGLSPTSAPRPCWRRRSRGAAARPEELP